MEPATEVAPTQSRWNANSYHWEEKDFSTWSKDRIRELLKDVSVSSGSVTLSVSSVSRVDGDAIINVRKGKRRVGYEMKIELKVKGVVADSEGEETSVEGDVALPYVCEDVDDRRFSVQINGLQHNLVRAVADTDFKRTVLDRVNQWIDELGAK
jgi:activator of HSP90 ATPase